MGYGDDLMTSGTAREMKKKFPSAKILIGDGENESFSPVFWHNPHIDHLPFVTPKDQLIWIDDYPTHRPYLDYQKSTAEKQIFVPNFKAMKGELYFTERELETAQALARNLGRFIVIEPNIDSLAGKNKDWGFEKWQEAVNQLSDKIKIVQLGKQENRMLQGAQHIFTPTFRAASALLSYAELYAGPEGGLHHASAALNVPAVVIFGGRISPKATGYEGHVNFYIDLPESPCGRISLCSHCEESMKLIPVEQVLTAVEQLVFQEATQ